MKANSTWSRGRRLLTYGQIAACNLHYRQQTGALDITTHKEAPWKGEPRKGGETQHTISFLAAVTKAWPGSLRVEGFLLAHSQRVPPIVMESHSGKGEVTFICIP